MNAHWINSPTARRVLEHWADARPTWLWSGDGQTLLWRNLSARAFQGKAKKQNPWPAREAVPIRGQISRLIRLGSLNRASLSRMQFLAGDRPISATCACTPLAMADGQTALMIVDVDPVSAEPGELQQPDAALLGLLPAGTEYLLIEADGRVAGGSPAARELYAPAIEARGVPSVDAEEQGVLGLGDGSVGFTRFKASPGGAVLLLFAASETDQPRLNDRPMRALSPAEPLLPMGLPPLPPATSRYRRRSLGGTGAGARVLLRRRPDLAV